MSKNASVSTLLAVAVVALALMGFIGFRDGATGMQMGGISPGYTPPRVEDSTAYTIHSGIASQYTQGQKLSQDTLHAILLVNCRTDIPLSETAKQELYALCKEYSVQIT